MKKILVTGAGGLIGSEVVRYFVQMNMEVIGIDNNMRADFFGEKGDTTWNLKNLEQQYPGFTNFTVDIRNRDKILSFIKEHKPHAIVHTAAQPSHELATSRPFDDFDVNALGTLNLLEANRQADVTVPFVHLSTNKVYGDSPNFLNLKELETRYEYEDKQYYDGINESFNIDQCKHSLFGASKVAADIMVQEYGRYFNMPTCCLRGGCLTGPNHSGVELHGFLSYLVKCNLEGREYQLFGYKGKQVRDNIHSVDVARFMYEFAKAPRAGEVYNIGGGKDNSCSVIEAFTLAEKWSGQPMQYRYVEQNRIGDHICYYSDLRKMRAHYPGWDITVSLEETIAQIVEAWQQKLVS